MANKPDPDVKRLKELVHYDPKTGIFTHVKARGGRAAGSRADQLLIIDGKHYRRVCIDGQSYTAHRLAFVWMTGSAPKWPNEVDHRDRNGENNRWKNLRSVTRSQNINNRRKLPSLSGETYIGATKDGRWRVRIRGSDHGTYRTMEEAKRVRNRVQPFRHGVDQDQLKGDTK